MLLPLKMFTQQYLIVNNGGKLFVIDYDTKEKLMTFDSYSYKEKIDIATIYGFEFIGYDWQSDSLKMYLEKMGRVTFKMYKLSVLKQLSKANIEFFTENLDALYNCTNNNKTIYRYDEIKLVTDGISLRCYNDSTLLWERRCSSYTGSIAMSGLGYYMPVLSPDKKSILIQKNKINLFLFYNKTKLFEINLSTGKETKISNRSEIYSYSPNGKYILFKKGTKGRLCIYDKKSKKVTIHYSWNNAYWLTK